MKAVPDSRRGRIVAATLLVCLAGAVAWRWDDLVFLAKLVVPGPAYEQANDRSSEPAPIAERDVPLPEVTDAPEPPAADPAIDLEQVATIENPTALADPPGPGPVFVTTQAGELLTLDLDTSVIELVMDLTDRVDSGGERGLLGVAIDPEGERLYLDYTAEGGDTEIRSWPLDDLGGEGVLHLEIGQPYANHNGGNLVFGPDGALWIGTGDGGGAGDRQGAGQDPDTLLGKMLRVLPDPDGGVTAPASNDAPGDRPEVWAIGLRNPWRYSFDRATNRLWVADVGQNSVEEVSVVDPDRTGVNFGWNVLEGTNTYEGDPRPDFVDPVIEFGHDDGACSVTGGFVSRGPSVPSLSGWYVFGDYCGGWIRAVPADDPTAEPTELVTQAGPVRSFAELENGDLLVLLADGVHALTPP